MSCCGTNFDKSKNQEIERYLEEERNKFDQKIKLLLLGSGESGKSTFAKQMRILHLNGFSLDEKQEAKVYVYRNVVTSMRSILNGLQLMKIPLEDHFISDCKAIENLGDYYSDPISPDLRDSIKRLWASKGVQQAYARQSEFQLYDSAGYFLDKIDEISSEVYSPSDLDILKIRNKTTGVIEIDFQYKGNKFTMVDVGGQRSERRKWLHCFQEVTSVLFLVALSEYDLKLYEDVSVNRMDESLRLFHQICNSHWFSKTTMILLLNKKDLFAEKIKKVDLNVCFPEYTGGKDYSSAITFITDKFLFQNENPHKNIYTHVICTTDTENVKIVFQSVRDSILKRTVCSEESIM